MNNKVVVYIRLRTCPVALWWVSLSVCRLLSYFEYAPFRVAYFWPLHANVTSSINRKYITFRNTATGRPSHSHK